MDCFASLAMTMLGARVRQPELVVPVFEPGPITPNAG